MRTSKPIHIVVHQPNDIKAFEDLFIKASFDAIRRIAQKTSKGNSSGKSKPDAQKD